MNLIAKKNKALFQGLKAGAVLLKTNDLFPDSSVSYFTGIGKQFLSSNLLLLRPGRQPLLIKSFLEPDIRAKGLRVQKIDKKKQLEKVLRKELKGIKAIGLNKQFHTAASLRVLRKPVGKKKLVDVSGEIASMRAIKSGPEIQRISKACKIAQGISKQIPSIFRNGMTEKQLAMRVETLLREKGENILPFPVIVASGANARFPHYVAGERKIRSGLLLLDFGAYYKNHCSDITRVFSAGKPTKKQLRLYASVFAVKQFAQSAIRPGIEQQGVFAEANSLLKKQTGIKLVHGLGHGLGVDAHDFPRGFLEDNKEKLQKNMVLTVEPGVYGRFGGIRIEDDVVVTAKGCKPLTKAPAGLVRL